MRWAQNNKARTLRNGLWFKLQLGLRQFGCTHQVTIALTSSATTFIKGPDDETLTTTAVTRGKDAREAGSVLLVLSFDVGTSIAFDI